MKHKYLPFLMILREALQEEWRKIPSKVYINLIESMPRRINACIESQGWSTKY